MHSPLPAPAVAVLTRWYEGEVGGEALFSELARRAPPGQSEKWQALARLESRMGGHIRAALLAHRCELPRYADPQSRAHARCDALAGNTWNQTMDWLHGIADEALKVMETEAERLPPDCAALGRRVIGHEKALMAFAEKELAGLGHESRGVIDSQP